MTSRRRFLARSGQLSLAAWAAIGQFHLARAAQTGDVEAIEVLARVARLMFPHDGLQDDVYRGLVGELLADESIAGLLNAGATALGDFLHTPERVQIQQLELIQDGEFFTEMKTELSLSLYNDRTLWELIGYPGPSFPAGYVGRGFDDIDWLPE